MHDDLVISAKTKLQSPSPCDQGCNEPNPLLIDHLHQKVCRFSGLTVKVCCFEGPLWLTMGFGDYHMRPVNRTVWCNPLRAPMVFYHAAQSQGSFPLMLLRDKTVDVQISAGQVMLSSSRGQRSNARVCLDGNVSNPGFVVER